MAKKAPEEGRERFEEKMNRINLVIVSILLIYLSGCVQTKTIEDMGIISSRGVDALENDRIKTTMVYFQFSKKEKQSNGIVSGEAHTLKRAREKANHDTGFTLATGSIQLELYGKEAAKKGLLRYVDPLIRDAKISDSMYLAISESTAEDILLTGYKDQHINMDRYLHELIKQNIRDHVIPKVTLMDFLNGYYKIGRDPYLPILSIKDKKPVLSSLGLLRDDQFVGKVSLDDAYLITLLGEPISELDIEAVIPLKPFKNHMESGPHQHTKRKYAYASFNVRKGKTKTKLLNKRDVRFQTNVKLDVDLLELSEEIHLGDPKVIKKLEKEVESEIKHRYKKLLNYTQELNTDPFGYGVVYRTQGRTHTSMEEWRDIYPKINVTFNVEVRILHHGVLP